MTQPAHRCVYAITASLTSQISLYVLFDRIIEIRLYADILACLIEDRDHILMNADTVMLSTSTQR